MPVLDTNRSIFLEEEPDNPTVPLALPDNSKVPAEEPDIPPAIVCPVAEPDKVNVPVELPTIETVPVADPDRSIFLEEEPARLTVPVALPDNEKVPVEEPDMSEVEAVSNNNADGILTRSISVSDQWGAVGELMVTS